MNKLQIPKLSKYEAERYFRSILRMIHSYQIMIISTLVLVLLGYAILEVGKVANTSITPAQEQQKQAELAQKEITFDEEVIAEIQSRLREDVEVTPQDLGTDNPFKFNN